MASMHHTQPDRHRRSFGKTDLSVGAHLRQANTDLSVGARQRRAKTETDLPAVLTGEDNRVNLMLQHTALVQLKGAEKVVVLDGNNSFNAYFLADVYKLQGINVHDILNKILVSRNFTAHQIMRNIESHLDRNDYPICILGLMNLFLDEQMQNHEAGHLFRRSWNALLKMSKQKFVAISIDLSYVVSDRAKKFLRIMRKDALFSDTTLQNHQVKQLLENNQYMRMHYY